MQVKEASVGEPKSMGEALQNTMGHALELARAEIALAKREVGDQLRSLAGSAVLLVAGAMVLQAAITSLCMLLVLEVQATVLVVAVVASIFVFGFALLIIGLKRAKGATLRTPKRLEVDVHTIQEAIK